MVAEVVASVPNYGSLKEYRDCGDMPPLSVNVDSEME
jgi:hypothetical protein